MRENLMRGVLGSLALTLAIGVHPVQADGVLADELKTTDSEATVAAETQAPASPAPAAEAKKAPEKPGFTLTIDKGAPKFASADGKTWLKFNLRLHEDFRAPEAGAYNTNGTKINSSFVARRQRIGLGGSINDSYDFLLVTDFGAGGAARFKDAWITVKASTALNFTAGQHKVPYGYEWQHQSSNYTEFVERSMAFTSANPQYDLGFSVKGEVLDKKVGYWVGYFNGEGEVTFPDSNDEKEWAGRLRFQPIPGLFFGVNGTTGKLEGKTSPAGRLSTGFTFINGVPMSGSRTRWGVDAQYFNGPFSFKAEYLGQSDARKNLGAGGRDLDDITMTDFWVSASYLLTGDKKPATGVDPKSPIDLRKGTGTGAWEIAVRWERLDYDSDEPFSTAAPLGNAVDEFTAGINFYMNVNTRLMLNFNYYKFDDALRTPFSYDPVAKKVGPGKTDFFEILSRLSFYF